jgi:hypothetical protein
MLFNHINLMYLLLGIAIGIIAQFVIVPEKMVVVKYPDPSKTDAMVFRDSNGTCFKFSASEVDCKSNEWEEQQQVEQQEHLLSPTQQQFF